MAKTPVVRTGKGPDKIKIIVEQTTQYVFECDPDDEKTKKAIGSLQKLIVGEIIDPVALLWDRHPPKELGKRAGKGVYPVVGMLKSEGLSPVTTYERFVSVTTLYPDEDGWPALEVKVTPKTAIRKPVTE